MAVAIKPLEDRIVIKANDAEQTTASGLVIPDTAKEKPQEGTVVAVGPGRFDDGVRVPMDVKVGDRVDKKKANSFLCFVSKNKEPLLGKWNGS